METSDDAVLDTLIQIGSFGLGEAKGKHKRKPPSVVAVAEKATKTATAIEQQSEQKKLNKRRKASLLTRDFGPATVSRPTLGQAGLLGVN